MDTRTVTSQAELDAALADSEVDYIEIRSPQGVWLEVRASDSTTVHAYDSATVHASDSTTVHAYDSTTVHAYDSTTVRAYGSATVRAYGSATVHAYGSATVHAYDSATVRAYGSATVRAYGSATVRAYGSATVHAYGSATVHAYDSATVHASGSATVRAYDSATVHAYGSATVHASSRTAVHLHPGHARINGGVLIDHTDEDHATPELWCEIHGIEFVDGWATVYKAVRADLRSAHGFAYPIGETVTCKDWADNGECGNGLHFSPSPSQALTYDAEATRFLQCRVSPAELRPLFGGPAKCKARSAVVVREVDEWLRPVSAQDATIGETP